MCSRSKTHQERKTAAAPYFPALNHDTAESGGVVLHSTGPSLGIIATLRGGLLVPQYHVVSRDGPTSSMSPGVL